MNKSNISSHVATQASLSKATADSVIDAMFSSISDALAGGEPVTVAGFGTLTTKSRAARQGRKPRTAPRSRTVASRSRTDTPCGTHYDPRCYDYDDA